MKLQKWIYSIIILFTISCNYNDTTKGIFTPGLIKVDIERMSANDTIYLLSDNCQIINALVNDNDEWRFENDITCRAHYPDYGIIFFDGYQRKGNLYKIYCNDTWCYILAENYTKYISWDDFIVNYAFLSTHSSNPVRVKPKINAESINLDYDNVYFLAKQVENEWLFVDIYYLEQTTPFMQGWLKWRCQDMLLIDINYDL